MIYKCYIKLIAIACFAMKQPFTILSNMKVSTLLNFGVFFTFLCCLPQESPLRRMKNAPATGVMLSRREQRNLTIRNDYARLFKDGLRSEVILDKLADRFALEPDTVERIVRGIGHYRPTAALSAGATAA